MAIRQQETIRKRAEEDDIKSSDYDPQRGRGLPGPDSAHGRAAGTDAPCAHQGISHAVGCRHRQVPRQAAGLGRPRLAHRLGRGEAQQQEGRLRDPEPGPAPAQGLDPGSRAARTPAGGRGGSEDPFRLTAAYALST